MRFLFLGTGTSAGVPAIGCDCAVCLSEDPRDRRLRTAAAVQFTDARGQERTILLDAGPDLRQQALRAGLRRCDAIVFTHNHVDHTFGLDEVRRFNAVQQSPIDVWADDHTMDHLKRVYRHIFERDKNVNDSFVATLIPQRIEDRAVAEGSAINLWGALFTPVRLLHGRLPVLGFRIDFEDSIKAANPGAPFPLAYCTDVSGVPPESWSHLYGLKTLVLDALRHRHHPTHLTLNQAVHIAGELQAESAYFVHMAHDLPHEATQADLPPRMFLAWDGLVLGN
ncbi:phosphoribosyl 1,2-cyclic phosphate phosphodiesterase [Phycisphaerales bacterium]|nr:phosphoribosyl 1,2-cyclic phosphate phosphodiesterase [Phycisphaerales bacterium]